MATVSRIDKIIGLFRRISSLLLVSFAKETYNLIDPTIQSHPISDIRVRLPVSMRDGKKDFSPSLFGANQRGYSCTPRYNDSCGQIDNTWWVTYVSICIRVQTHCKVMFRHTTNSKSRGQIDNVWWVSTYLYVYEYKHTVKWCSGTPQIAKVVVKLIMCGECLRIYMYTSTNTL